MHSAARSNITLLSVRIQSHLYGTAITQTRLVKVLYLAIFITVLPQPPPLPKLFSPFHAPTIRGSKLFS
jgi:hypothetical protein